MAQTLPSGVKTFDGTDNVTRQSFNDNWIAVDNKFKNTGGHNHSGVDGQGPKIDYNNLLNKPSSMTPTAHKSTHASGGSDAISPADIGAIAASSGAVTDTYIGNRTVDQALANPANTGPLTSLLSWIVGRIKAITGKANWWEAPVKTLQEIWDELVAHKADDTKHVTKDGTLQTGLNADKLDGNDASAFATANHTHSYLPLSGGTMTGILTAQNNTSYTTSQVRNIILSTADPSGGGNGDVWIKYTS